MAAHYKTNNAWGEYNQLHPNAGPFLVGPNQNKSAQVYLNLSSPSNCLVLSVSYEVCSNMVLYDDCQFLDADCS